MDPERFGVREFDDDFRALAGRKAKQPLHLNWAVTGLYFYDSKVVEVCEARETVRAWRAGRITSINQMCIWR